MKKTNNTSRRASERASCRLKTNYSSGDGPLILDEAKNISEGGILLIVSGDVKRDDLLDLEIQLGPQEKPVKAKGRVVHTRKKKTSKGTAKIAGVAFLNLTDKQREAIGKRVWQQILEEATRTVKKK